MKTLLVIPNYNHSISCNTLIDKLALYDTLIIDDGSTIPFQNKSKYSKSIILRNSINRGKGYSIKKAANFAISKHYTHILTIDADLQHDPIFLEKFISEIKDNDFIYGKRNFSINMPVLRKLSNTITSKIISYYCDKDILDSQCGYRIYNLDLFKNLNSEEHGYHFETEILLKKINKYSKIRYVEISTIYNGSKSHINNILDTIKFVKLVIKSIYK